MTTPWVIAFLSLSIVVLTVCVLMLGLSSRIMERLGQLEAALAPMATLPFTGPNIGDVPPRLPLGLSRVPGREDTLVLFLEFGCQPCRVLAEDLKRHPISSPGVTTVVVVDDTRLLSRNSISENLSILTDSGRAIAESWGVNGTPVAFFLSAQGKVTARTNPNSVADVNRLLRENNNLTLVASVVPMDVAQNERKESHHDR